GGVPGGGPGSGPGEPHLELRSASLAGADFAAEVAAREGATLAVLDRGRHAVAYAKATDAIADVLAAAGASDAILAFEESAVMAATRGRANRLANADHANLVRASRAAHAQLRALAHPQRREQLRAVEHLQRGGGLAEPPRPLQEIAELRAPHPSLSLRELALKCRPPVTKAAAHRRLRKLQRLAEH